MGVTLKTRPAGHVVCGSAPAGPVVVKRSIANKKESFMLRAEIGSIVTIRYVGTLDNGRIFISTDEHGPQTLTIGTGEIFPALEQAIIGMRIGETKNIVLSTEEAYGPRLQENIISVARQAFPMMKEVIAGQKLSIEFTGGSSQIMVVTSVNENDVTLDGNHPLAGLELTFALTLDRVA